ncbi:MAG: tetratricopeptide repeat protein, partial [Bryobacteraceae bacterium]
TFNRGWPAWGPAADLGVRRPLALTLLFVGLVCAQVSVDDAMRMVAAGRLDEAETALRNLTAANPRDADLHYRLGLVLVKQKKLDEAGTVLSETTRIDPKFVFAWLALSDLSFRRGDSAAAIAQAKRAEERAGDSATAWKALAVLEARIGDAGGQARALEGLLRLTPEDRQSRLRLANLLLEHRNANATLAVTDGFPNDAELLRLHGLALYGLGRKEEAIDSFLAAMEAAPKEELVHAAVETLLPDAGNKLPQIRERLNRFMSERPDSPLGPFLLALASGSDEGLLRKAISIDPNFWPAYFELHRILRAQGKIPEAIEALETTLRLNPNHEGAHYALAQLYLETGDRKKAQEHRAEHHRLRAAAAEAEQKRSADAPKLSVTTQ